MSGQGSLRKKIAEKQHGLTNRKQTLGAVASISEIRAQVHQLTVNLQGLFKKYDSTLDALTRTVNALTDLVGKDQVINAISETRIAEFEESIEAQEKQIQLALEKGVVTSADKISGPGTMVVIEQKTPQGEVVHPRRIYSSFGDLVPELQPLLEQVAVGGSLPMPDGRTVTLVACYEAVVQPNTDAPSAQN